MSDLTPIPPYMEGWDEETIYIDRKDVATAEEALAAFRRISLEDMGLSEEDIEGIEARAVTVPSHDADESTHNFDGPCPDCHPADMWMFAP